MKKKISESIQIKTFLSMLALLIVSCVLIYGLVMFFLPRNYHAELQSQVTADFYELVEIIEQNGWESSTNSILEFALKNNASVTVTDGAALTSELTDLLIEKVYVFPDNRIEIVYKVHDLFE